MDDRLARQGNFEPRVTLRWLYSWLMSPEQEEKVCDALVNLGPIETEQGLHAEGVRAIQGALHCSIDDARTALHDLRARQQIQEAATPTDERADYGPLPGTLFRWVRPGT